MHEILTNCTFNGAPAFPDNVNHLITHFLGGAYTYQIRFGGNKYKLRVCGHAKMTLQKFLELFFKHAYGNDKGAAVGPTKITTKKKNLLLLRAKYISRAPLIVTTRQSVTRYAPREKRIGKFCHLILNGVFDWNSDKRHETTIELGHFQTMPEW